jgi:hypothetical protein
MNEDEFVEVPPDDLSPQVRECFRAIAKGDRQHMENCPDCLEDEARTTLMDAASHRLDGNEEDALALEEEAKQLRARAAKLRNPPSPQSGDTDLS